LYGWNTLGAVCGAVGAELVLVGWVGVVGSAWVAALLNLGAASIALVFSNRPADDEAVIAGAPIAKVRPAPLPNAAQAPAAPHPSLLLCATLAGGALLALEVVWFRFLSM
jgi:hypothetical protein